jgi:hypothetical protein
MKWLLLLLCLSLATPAYAAKPKVAKVKTAKEEKPVPRKETSGEASLGRLIEKTIQRENDHEMRTYAGVLVHTKRGKRIDTAAWLVDCDGGQICELTGGRSGCYYDLSWIYTAPKTYGDAILTHICGEEVDMKDAPTNAEPEKSAEEEK